MAAQPNAHDADDLLAVHFTTAMNAATSRYGVLADVPFSFAATAALATAAALTGRLVSARVGWGLAVLALLPLVVCVLSQVCLRNGRARVQQWLRTVPFAVHNLPALLAGAGEYFEIHFADAMPKRELVMEHFESVDERPFVLECDEQRKVVSARFGVNDAKHNPLRSAFVRYALARRILCESLSALHRSHRIDHVLIV